MGRYCMIFLAGTWFLAPAIAAAQTSAPGTGLADFYRRTGHYQTAAFYAEGKKNVDKKKNVDEPVKPPTSLEQHIAEALKNNPDIRVAEAKVREAEAELNRTRMKAISDLTLLHADIMAAHAVVAEAEARFERAKRLLAAKTMSVEEYEAVVQTLARAKAELAARTAKLPYLLGKQTDGSSSSALIDDLIKKRFDVRKIEAPSDEDFLRRLMLDLQGRVPTAEEMKSFLKMPEKDRREKWVEKLRRDEFTRIHKGPQNAGCVRCHVDAWLGTDAPADHHHRMWVDKYWQIFLKPESPKTEKLRKSLDATTFVNFDKVPLKTVLEFLEAKKGVFNFHVRGKARGEAPVTVKLTTPVSIGAVLQFLEDEHDVIFVLREYGIVVIAADERLPPGAIRVIDFWKHGKTADPRSEPKDKAKPGLDSPAKPPKESSRGVIEKVDPKDPSLVQISLGSGAGLEKGHTLDAFRLQPEPKFLGRVQIIEVMSTKSVGRVLSRNGLEVRAGDQVASNLTEK